jgi:hypothetical protein
MVGKRLYGRFYVDGQPPWTQAEQGAVSPGSVRAQVLEYPLVTENHRQPPRSAVAIPEALLVPHVSDQEMAELYRVAFRQFEMGNAPGVLRFTTVVSDGPKPPDMWTVVVEGERERGMRVELSAVIPSELARRFRTKSSDALVSTRVRVPMGVDSSYAVVEYGKGSCRSGPQTMIEVEGADWFLPYGGVGTDIASSGRIVLGETGELQMTYPWMVRSATDVNDDPRFDLTNLVRSGFPDERSATAGELPPL